jgi:hypothetical protein
MIMSLQEMPFAQPDALKDLPESQEVPSADEADETENISEEIAAEKPDLEEPDAQEAKGEYDEKADAQIPVFSDELLERARVAGLPPSVAQAFGEPVHLENHLRGIESRSQPETPPNANEPPVAPEPPKDPFDIELPTFALTPEQREDMDPGILNVVDSMTAHYQGLMDNLVGKLKENMSPLIGDVGFMRTHIQREFETKAESEFDREMDGLAKDGFEEVIGSGRDSLNKQQFLNRQRLYNQLPGFMEEQNQIRADNGLSEKLTKHEALAALVEARLGFLKKDAKGSDTKKKPVEERIEEQKDQMLGRPQAGPAKLVPSKPHSDSEFKQSVPFAMPDGAGV